MNTFRGIIDSKFLKQKSSLKEDSFDTNKNQYLFIEELESYCFDKIVAQEMTILPCKSVDSMFFGTKKDKLFLIEFKNQETIKHDDIKIKIYETLIFMLEKLKLPYELLFKEMVEIIIVYNPMGNYKMRRHYEKINNPETNPLKRYEKVALLTEYSKVNAFICSPEELSNYLKEYH